MEASASSTARFFSSEALTMYLEMKASLQVTEHFGRVRGGERVSSC
jgi:hypothetical protein